MINFAIFYLSYIDFRNGGVGDVVARALEMVEDQEPEAMEGHIVAYLDEGAMMRCSRWFKCPTAWGFL